MDAGTCVKTLPAQNQNGKEGTIIMTTITKDMSIGEVLALDETTEPILTEYGMHCMGCPVSQMETLEQGCAVHGTDVNELVARLNAYLAGRA